MITIARRGAPFDDSERELFAYLAGQAAVSIENADLHETVQRQAVTDELTGLSNLRHFHDSLAGEIERSRRFNQPVGLVMLDIDDFKAVNDTYGHQQGDIVLSKVARVLRELSRDIDEPARYGGEEMAVILPQTDLDGAELAAERMRQAIEALEIERIDGDEPLARDRQLRRRVAARVREGQGGADRRGRRRAVPGQARRQERRPQRGPGHRRELRFRPWEFSTTPYASTWS